jgi:hypothetical protein
VIENHNIIDFDASIVLSNGTYKNVKG